jgi:hypothetical protein
MKIIIRVLQKCKISENLEKNFQFYACTLVYL